MMLKKAMEVAIPRFVRQFLFAILAIVFPTSEFCWSQTALELLDRARQAMAPPVKFKLSVNGRSCTVFQNRLDDQSIAVRMEFGSINSYARIESAGGCFEIYPKNKNAIDIGFMHPNSNVWAPDDVIPLGSAESSSFKEAEFSIDPNSEFDGKKCWKLSRSLPKEFPLASASDKFDQDRTLKEVHFYIELESYKLMGTDSISKAGQKVLHMKISRIEKLMDMSNELFVPPADFEMHRPQSIVEYLSARESQVTKQVISRLEESTAAIRAQTASRIAATKARVPAPPRMPTIASRNFYFLPILFLFMVFMIIASRSFALQAQRSSTNHLRLAAVDPALPPGQRERILETINRLEATNVSAWTRFCRAPMILKVFIAYCVCSVILGFALPFTFSPSAFRSPGTGIQFLAPLIITFSALSRLELRTSIYFAVILIAFYGAINANMQSIGTSRPPTVISARFEGLQVVLNVVMPIAWALLLVSPSMRKWIHSKSTADDQINQLTMADFLYFMFVASVAMAGSVFFMRWIS